MMRMPTKRIELKENSKMIGKLCEPCNHVLQMGDLVDVNTNYGQVTAWYHVTPEIGRHKHRGKAFTEKDVEKRARQQMQNAAKVWTARREASADVPDNTIVVKAKPPPVIADLVALYYQWDLRHRKKPFRRTRGGWGRTPEERMQWLCNEAERRGELHAFEMWIMAV